MKAQQDRHVPGAPWLAPAELPEEDDRWHDPCIAAHVRVRIPEDLLHRTCADRVMSVNEQLMVVENYIRDGDMDPNEYSLICQERPIHAAVTAQRYRLVRLLIREGADPNGLDGNGCTPMQRAIMNDDGHMVDVLEACGAVQFLTDDTHASGEPRRIYVGDASFYSDQVPLDSEMGLFLSTPLVQTMDDL